MFTIYTTQRFTGGYSTRLQAPDERPNLPDFVNGDITLTKIGHRGAGIHMFYKTPANVFTDTRPGNLDSSLNETAPDVFLSLRVPW
jgi:hypothetical protein